jgi:multidrug efflux system membrane fusion protein
VPSVWVLMGVAVTMGVALSGCGHKPLADTDTSPPAVSVSQPIAREITDSVDFIGRIEAPSSLDVRARVTGYLVKIPFREGAEVRAGDLLFEIDDRPYKDELDLSQASLERAKASLVKAQAFLDIGLETQKLSSGAVSQQEIVQRQGSRDEAAASVQSAQATLEKSQLNFDWCKVTSAIDGRVSRYFLTVGNLVSQDTTQLTTVVSEDPLYAYFDIDERTLLRILRHLLPNEVDLITTKQLPVSMGLTDEDGFPHTGYIDFANNVVNPATGTMLARGVFANPITASGRRLLKPGMFVRIRLPIGKPHQALLVSEKAMGTDQGQKFLYTVDAQNLVQYRRVKVGPLQSDGLRVIEEGLQPGEWVLISGLQLVHPSLEVKRERTVMTGDAEGTPAKAEGGTRSAEGKNQGKETPLPKSSVPEQTKKPAADGRATAAPSDNV